jgi:phage anti-repressor protein
VGKHKPRLFSSNRKYHREFWEWLPYETQYFNISKSSEIFKNWLGFSPDILVPPGNVYSIDTIKICEELNFKTINSSKTFHVKTNIRILNNDNGVINSNDDTNSNKKLFTNTDESDFVIDLEVLAKWLKAEKKHLKETLSNTYINNIDYKVSKKEINTGGRKSELILLTPDCMKRLCMSSRTKKAEEVRTYFIELEKHINKYKSFGIPVYF